MDICDTGTIFATIPPQSWGVQPTRKNRHYLRYVVKYKRDTRHRVQKSRSRLDTQNLSRSNLNDVTSQSKSSIVRRYETDLRNVVMLAESFQLRVEVMNTIFMRLWGKFLHALRHLQLQDWIHTVESANAEHLLDDAEFLQTSSQLLFYLNHQTTQKVNSYHLLTKSLPFCWHYLAKRSYPSPSQWFSPASVSIYLSSFSYLRSENM